MLAFGRIGFAFLFPILFAVDLKGESAQPKPALEIFKEKGTASPAEVLTWNAPEKVQKGKKRFLNRFYRVDFPKCFDVSTGAGETDPKTASIVQAYPPKKCKPSSEEKFGFEIAKERTDKTRRFKGVKYPNEIVRQKALINGQDSLVVTSVHDHTYSTEDSGYLIGWGVFTYCGDEIFQVGTQTGSSAEASDRVARDDYSLPKSLVDIASTFKCAKSLK